LQKAELINNCLLNRIYLIAQMAISTTDKNIQPMTIISQTD